MMANNEKSDSRKVEVSKEMAYKLRHDPPKGMDGCGFVDVKTLAESMKCTKPEPDELVQIAETDEKGRYQMGDPAEEGALVSIRATQGHSFQLDDALLDPVNSPDEVPIAIHATSEAAWKQIQECGELRKMNRTMIHFAPEPKHVRADEWAQVLLQVDLRKAVEAGIKVCKAANGVVLTEGPVPLEYVQRVWPEELPLQWREHIEKTRGES